MLGQSRPERYRTLLTTGLLSGVAVIIGMLLLRHIRPPEPDPGVGVSTAPARQGPALTALPKAVASSNDDPSQEDLSARAIGIDVIEAILSNSELTSAQKAQSLLEAMDVLSGPPAVAACEQALLRLDAESYQPAFAKLVDDGVELEIRQSIMADLMDRSDFLRLPLLVRLASLPEHPFADEARMELMAVLGDDYGSNWLGWSDGVATYLESISGVTGAGIQE